MDTFHSFYTKEYETATTGTEMLEEVKHYYGSVLKNSRDLKTDACCCSDSMPEAYKEIVDEIHPEILRNFCGCGSPNPPALDGCTVLDLGCGTGCDVYLVSNWLARRAASSA